MANKNTKQKNKKQAKARVGNDGVVSFNKKRNSAMRVYLNRVEGGQTQSLTVHEPWVKHEPMLFPNHRQYDNWEYRRPGGANIASQASA